MDESAGRNQSYVEDCQICCRPNVLQISYASDLDGFLMQAELE